jgi:hypothetical protein
VKGRAYRAHDESPALENAVLAQAAKTNTGRVVRKTAEGIPPQVVIQPKP